MLAQAPRDLGLQRPIGSFTDGRSMGTAWAVTHTQHDCDAPYQRAGETYRLAMARVVVVLGRVAEGTATAGELTAAVAAKDAAAKEFAAAYRDRARAHRQRRRPR